MFIDVSKLEKILKEDYKSWGVEIGLTEDGMYIVNGTGWIIEADESSITKEFLGTLIKICGPAPKRGEFIQYQKGSSLQYTTARSKILWDMIERSTNANLSLLKVEQNGDMCTIVQTTSGARLLKDKKLAIIDPGKCAADEECPSVPLVHEDWFICHNDELAVGLCFTALDYKPELEVLRLLSGVDFFWKELDQYRLG